MRHTCILYSNATCDLNCKYCYIDKSHTLNEIDSLLDKSYQGDYYFNFMKEMFPKDQMKTIEIWGGEPTHGLHRLIPTLKQALKYFPNLNTISFSTNLVSETCVDSIINFIEALNIDKQLTFKIQLSIDGPTEINDYNRGEGTTEQFTKNFHKFISKMPSRKQTIIKTWFKPTLTIRNIIKLQTKESITDYYNFLKNYKTIFNSYDTTNFFFSLGAPTIAAPSAHTTEEGIIFKNFCNLINQLAQDNHFKAMPYFNKSNRKEVSSSIYCGCGTCGTGRHVLGLLPNNLVAGCHNSFVELIEEYKQAATANVNPEISKEFWEHPPKHNSTIFTKEDYLIYEHSVSCYSNPNSCFQTAELATLIKYLAHLGQIDSKYINKQTAIEGANFIQSITSNCLRDNINTTGSKYLRPLGFIRLFLNGAREEIEYYYDLFRTK